MARNRIIKPQLFADEKLSQCSVDARFLFIGLLIFVDDMGRMEYHARRVQLEVFPGDGEDYNAGMVQSLVDELASVKVIELYEVNRKQFLRIPHFLDHQYIQRKTHTNTPPAPSEGVNAAKCLCLRCQAKGNHSSNDRRALVEDDESAHSTFSADAEHVPSIRSAHASRNSISNRNSNRNLKDSAHGKSREDIHTGESDENQPDPTPSEKPERNEVNPRARSAALTEIATNIFGLLKVDANHNILSTLIKSIEVRARSKQVSVEAAAQEIATRAAWIAGEAEPENWEDWFYDARYAYVPQGDKRLQDRRVEARPVCGGPRCTEGWESVKIGAQSVSRRCPDCVRLWVDGGYA